LDLNEDEYFLPAIRKVTDEIAGKKELLIRSTAWDPQFKVIFFLSLSLFSFQKSR
jgi:hypothetical protein